MQGGGLVGLDQQADAVAAAHAGDGGGGGAIDGGPDAAQGRVAAGEFAREVEDLCHVGAGEDDARHAAIGRHARGAAFGGFGPPEGVFVAAEDGADHGVVGLVGLQQRGALAPFEAARAACDLAHQLKGAFGGAQVGALQAKVGVDHADEGEQGEVVALGHDLGADDDVGPACGDGFDLGFQRAGGAVEV